MDFLYRGAADGSNLKDLSSIRDNLGGYILSPHVIEWIAMLQGVKYAGGWRTSYQ